MTNVLSISKSLYMPILAFFLGNLLFFYFSNFLLTGEPFLHKEIMIQNLNYVSLTYPDMSIFEGIYQNFKSFFECYFLDGGRGRFRYVGYFYESFSAHLSFLGYLPPTFYDWFSLIILSITSFFISFVSFIRTKSFILTLFIVMFFLISYPTLMIFEFHYRGPKVIAVLFLSIFFLLIETKINTYTRKIIFGIIIILGYLSDPFFILATFAFIISLELNNNSKNIFNFFKSKPSFKKVQPIYQSFLDLTKYYFIFVCISVLIIVLTPLIAGIFIDDAHTCSIIFGISNPSGIHNLTNFGYFLLLPANVFSLKSIYFGILFYILVFYLIYKSRQINLKPIYLLGSVFSFILISQLWPVKSPTYPVYPSYYGIIPQLILCMLIIETHLIFFKKNKRFITPIFYLALFSLSFTNLSVWNKYKDIFYAWSGSHLSPIQKKLWDSSDVKKTFMSRNFIPDINKNLLVPEFDYILYSHKYGDPELFWHNSKLELYPIIPFHLSRYIHNKSIKTIPKRFSKIPEAIVINSEKYKNIKNFKIENDYIFFQLNFPSGVFNGREGIVNFRRKNFSNGAVLPAKTLAGMSSKTIALISYKNKNGKQVDICRVDIPPYTIDLKTKNNVYRCRLFNNENVYLILNKINYKYVSTLNFELNK